VEARKFDSPHRNRAVTDVVYGGTGTDISQMREARARLEPPPSPYKVFWGELHGHSNLSDGTVDIDSYFRSARDVARLDFCALSDHDHGGVGRPELWDVGKWELIQDRVATYHDPGRFVTLLAYERDSYPWYNNLVLYYREGRGEMVRGVADGEITRDELIALLARDDIISVPHHTTTIDGGSDFSSIPLELMTPLMEVYSKWGTSEYFGNPNPVRCEARGSAWRDALEKGARMGCIAGSDEHGPNPGSFGKTAAPNNLRYPNPGLAAVLATELTREAIYEALQARRCYAASGARIVIDFRINSQPMGSELTLPRDARKDIYTQVTGEGPLETVTVVKNGEDYIVHHVDGAANTFSAQFYDYRTVRPTDYFYLRVTQVDGRQAWTSPIWVTVA